MFKVVREIIEYRDLLYMLLFRDIRVRYKQSIMGFFWAIFMPALIVLSGIIVKKAMSILSHTPLNAQQIGFVMVKSLPWSFFISSIRSTTQSLVQSAQLITKVYFPRIIIPLATVLARAYDFFIASLVLIVLLAVARVGVSVQLLWLPVILLGLFLLTLSVGLITSAGNLFFRDVRYIVEVFLMFGIFYSPVFYEPELFGKYKVLLMLNPISGYLESIKNVIVLHKAPDEWFAYSLAVSVVLFVISVFIFTQMEKRFAERV